MKMKERRRMRLSLLCFGTVLVAKGLSTAAYATMADTNISSAAQIRSVRPLPIVVKFREGTRVRLRSGRFLAEARIRADNEALEKQRLTAAEVEADISSAASLITGSPTVARLGRLFTLQESTLEGIRRDAEAKAGRPFADLDLFYRIDLRPGSDPEMAAYLVDQLKALPSVEAAYVSHPVVAATADLPPTTPSFEFRQGYLESAAAGGIDARYSWTLPGGRGEGVKIVDVENHWYSHEDLPSLFYNGNGGGTLADLSHGLAVQGILTAGSNSYGITGIANQAQLGAQWGGDSAADYAASILAAGFVLPPGGVLLIELQLKLPGANCGCLNSCFIPVEYDLDVKRAIQQVAGADRVVVEAAGNGGTSIDELVCLAEVNASGTCTHSGAIMVGASNEGTNRSKTCFSNFGARVDLHSWGWNVATLGYGDMFGAGLGFDQYYTASFSGTSSASAIVAGAAAALQGVSVAHGLGFLSSQRVSDILRWTGTQSNDAIGSQPNLRVALDDYLSPPVSSFTFTCAGRACNFNGTASTDNYGIPSFLWTFGDNTSTTGTIVNHTYGRAGTFYVKLKVTDRTGRTNESTRAVTVN